MGLMKYVGAILLPIAFIWLVFKIMLIFVGKALIFSKIAVSLLVSFLLNNAIPFIGKSGISSYFTWLMIILAVTFILCRLPRTSCAYQLFCNFLISYLVIELICGIIFSIFFKDYDMGLIREIVMKLVCFLMSCKLVLEQMQGFGTRIIKNKVLIMIDRFAASFIYAVSMVVLIAINSSWDVSLAAAIIILIITFIITYFADIKCFERLQTLVMHRVSLSNMWSKTTEEEGYVQVDWQKEEREMLEREMEWEDEWRKECEWERKREEEWIHHEWEDHYYDYD